MAKDKNKGKNRSLLQKFETFLKSTFVKLAQWTLTDESGTIIEADVFEAGQRVTIVNGDDRVALPVGEYPTLENGIVVVKEEGIIDEIKESVEMSDDKKDFMTKSDFNKAMNEVKLSIANPKKMKKSKKKKKSKVEIEMKKQITALEKRIKAPKKFKHGPKKIKAKLSSEMSPKERILLSIQEQKN